VTAEIKTRDETAEGTKEGNETSGKNETLTWGNLNLGRQRDDEHQNEVAMVRFAGAKPCA
jgi:hypothetical protein